MTAAPPPAINHFLHQQQGTSGTRPKSRTPCGDRQALRRAATVSVSGSSFGTVAASGSAASLGGVVTTSRSACGNVSGEPRQAPLANLNQISHEERATITKRHGCPVTKAKLRLITGGAG